MPVSASSIANHTDSTLILLQNTKTKKSGLGDLISERQCMLTSATNIKTLQVHTEGR